MKFKYRKILLSMPVATMGMGLLATVLTSCNTSKIDDEKKITLNDEGKLSDNYGYKDAVKMALTRASSWATFKQALADEIIFKWYTDRMYQNDTKGTGKNKTFKSNYDQWNYQINKDYDSLVQSEKTKYGTNYKFYLQNEYLSQYGGTEASYKHAKLVEKVKTEFISNVFKFNYFSYDAGSQNDELYKTYPQIFAKSATTTVSRETLNNPTSWSKLGFFASTNPTYTFTNWPQTKSDIKEEFLEFLSKNPDGDYATIQNYVFNRFFNTEKPFYSSAALFKYSKPKEIEGVEKLSAIYDTSKTEVKLPDEPSEAFPFFGGIKVSDSSKGTRMFMEWLDAFNKGEFATEFGSRTTPTASNGSVTIPNTGSEKYSEDSQTLLLCSGAQMLGGSESLYIPYSTVASQMYGQMMLGASAPVNPYMNKSSQAYLETTKPATMFEAIENNPAIFKNFFFTPVQYEKFSDTATYTSDKLNSYLYLPAIYSEGLTGEGTAQSPYEYHCPLFKNVKSYNYLYGDMDATGTTTIDGKVWSNKSGVIFITNTMYIDAMQPTGKSGIAAQPWALQLNTSGMHAQTIDGYDFVVNTTNYLPGSTLNKSEALKQIFKYRLMQQRAEQIKVISGDLLGSSGKLKTYFTNNFANIILEMAMSDQANINIFKDINKLFADPESEKKEFFFNKICQDEKFDEAGVSAFIKATTEYDSKKKIVDSIDTANKAIYEYKSKIVQNSKSKDQMKTIYTNGLTAPLPYAYRTDYVKDKYAIGHNYYTCNFIEYIDISGAPKLDAAPTKADLADMLKSIVEATDPDIAKLFKQVTDSSVNGSNNPFDPQIKAAKDVMSNRYWYKSAIIDKVMYAFNGTKDGVANAIKYDTYEAYAKKLVDEAKPEDTGLYGWATKLETTEFKQAITATFEKAKVITGNVTYADLDPNKTAGYANYFTNINNWFNINKNNDIALAGFNGNKTSDIAMAQRLFESTLIYLSANNFENLYKHLNSKIGENEVGFVGYLDKLNPLINPNDNDKKPIDGTDVTIDGRYGWKPNVDNIYDQDGYFGNGPTGTHDESKPTSATYWNVVEKTLAGAKHGLAGFTGLQTKTSNTLDSASGLQDDIFSKFALSTQNSKNIDDNSEYNQNDGAWFAFAGNKESNGKEITFGDVWYEDDKQVKHTIKAVQFQGPEDETKDPTHQKVTKQVLRLAKKIANYDSVEDLKNIAKSLGDAFDGGSFFKLIGSGEKSYRDIDQMRYDMLEHLPHFKLDASGEKAGEFDNEDNHGKEFLNCFTRVKNVEAHTSTNLSSNKDYLFNDKKGNGYHLMLTQINKADITEKRLTPTWENGAWAQKDSPITPEEFLFILCSTALESSVQSLTVNAAIRTILKDDKLKVYDANLYNLFDSSWIKDWVKKPIGK